MMVPRAYLYASSPSSKANNKAGSIRRKSSNGTIRGFTPQQIAESLDIPYNASPSARPTPSPRNGRTGTDPVSIPTSRRSSHTEIDEPARRRPSKTDTIVTIIRDVDNILLSPPPKFQVRSTAELLAITKITPPRRLRPKQRRDFRSESLAEDFNRLLQEDVIARGDTAVVESQSYGSLDILLSPPDALSHMGEEQDDYLESKGVRGSPLSVRSISTESMPSLETDDESSISLSVPVTPGVGRKTIADRRPRLLSASEDCVLDHPLLPEQILDPPSPSMTSPTSPPPLRPRASNRPTPLPRSGSSTFKSNLTASLRALKYAAQSVSNFTSSSTPQEDFLTRSLFAFTPEMTDDRRPAPSSEPPSPALRRYLNPLPGPLIPADLHVYHEPPMESFQQSFAPYSIPGSPPRIRLLSNGQNCTASIQLQTYRRSSRSTSSQNPDTATAPPIFTSSSASPASTSPNSPTAFPPESQKAAISLSRQREPRENSDFLRMVVCEMAMRRKGKFRDDVPGRARIWLPARKMTSNGASATHANGDRSGKDNTVSAVEGPDGLIQAGVPRRWIAISVGR